MKALRASVIATVILSLLAIMAVSWHSVEEIHYLKTFYPRRLTVEEAYYAAWIEVLKVHIISLPLIVLILLGLYILWLYRPGKLE